MNEMDLNRKKIFVLLPDGVGLRNFAFTDFNTLGEDAGFEVKYWNNTIFDLVELNLNEVRIKNSKTHPWTDVLKAAKINISLDQFKRKNNDEVYDSYKFPFKANSFKGKLKILIIKLLIFLFNSPKGLVKIEKLINKKERITDYYRECKESLLIEKPEIVFCTNQRPITAVAPLLAAKDLGIPTATFIFSWDNLPKATMIVSTDYYFVWSDYMKSELQKYYPYISESQIFVTGTPQFEVYYSRDLIQPKEDFFQKYGLDNSKRYLCYSGDDVTTCPDDSQYLEDVANAVSDLNSEGENLGIIFRRCPVDFSDRYNSVLEKYKDIIVPIAPLWEKKGEIWNTVLPTKDDVTLLANTVAHSEIVVNLGSSMVFDFVTNEKVCCFINYDVIKKRIPDWSVSKIYKFVHFRSMPNKKAVVWLNSKEEIVAKLRMVLTGNNDVKYAQEWFSTINSQPANNASKRIWESLLQIVS